MTKEEAWAALESAREELDRVMALTVDEIGDPEAMELVRRAVQAERAAWERYREAATAGLARQISTIVPGEFLG